ncbi:MAG: electron transfer flavoprotein-ubiquinone oxidoreductase [Candidatus Eisenbacteria bacterium]|nr:electron transfer flavoprotein-ubiquinone oxidoreductase [Candidatus Eisenbacteria bacterium]
MPVEREVLDVDVLFVGAGPASLAGAIHLAHLIRARNEAAAESGGPSIEEPFIAVIEKGKEAHSHGLSGAVLDPRALKQLLPDYLERGCPLEAMVEGDDLFFLTHSGKIRAPFLPPAMRNHGNYVISLGRFNAWLAGIAEEEGVEIFPTFPGAEPILEEGRVAGVRTADKGRDKEGKEKPNFQPGADFRAKVTVFAEGPRGSLAKKLFRERPELVEGRNPQVYGAGVKEVWKVPDGRITPGRVIHTLGFPLNKDTYGGGWIYGMGEGRVSAGLVVGLDYHDPYLDPHDAFQAWKTHPLVRSILEGGEMEGYGAKTMPLGGYWSIPRLSMNGALLAGDSASFLNPIRLKGIHTAMKSGMLAAETILGALLKNDTGAESLAAFDRAIRSSWIREELRRSRNFHQGFDHGLWMGMIHAGLQMATGGRGIKHRMGASPGHTRMKSVRDYYGARPEPPSPPPPDNAYLFDKPTDVYRSGTEHAEDQPAHLKILDPELCVRECMEKYGAPCTRFCPAEVYEAIEEDGVFKGIRINFSNCVHCKTCDIMDPYENIEWTTPEGGGGPAYKNM